eukprot:TRINITY_DN990_c0_g1_i3.p1 TRINITY_DN990_c0_g1~~TRINITY_DN990_c0_g1_i3.p1  ORF type:complete len:490 (+),score=95.19 TRINITY_DN990_c0_g1_i3:33-1472(+)
MSNKCHSCSKTVYLFDGGIQARNNHYHKACFRCTTCKRVLAASSYDTYESKVYCQVHRPKASSMLSQASSNSNVDTFVQLKHKEQAGSGATPHLVILSATSTASSLTSRKLSSQSRLAYISKYTFKELKSLGVALATKLIVEDRVVDPNQKDEKERSILRLAVEESVGWMVGPLLEAGANAAYKNWQNVSLLHICVEKLVHSEVDLSIMEKLLEAGCDPNLVKRTTGDSPIHLLCSKPLVTNFQPALELLIKYGAKIDLPNKKEKTPLWIANSRSVAELLIQNGASVHSLNKSGKSLLHRAVKYSADLVNLYGSMGLDPNLVSNCFRRETPLEMFARVPIQWFQANNEIVSIGYELVKAGARLEGNGREPALFKAINYDRTQALLEIGCSPNVTNKNGDTKLHLLVAAPQSQTQTQTEMEYLLINGANPNAKNLVGKSPLHIAVCSASVEVCQLLLKYGADVDVADKVSPLGEKAHSGH